MCYDVNLGFVKTNTKYHITIKRVYKAGNNKVQSHVSSKTSSVYCSMSIDRLLLKAFIHQLHKQNSSLSRGVEGFLHNNMHKGQL